MKNYRRVGPAYEKLDVRVDEEQAASVRTLGSSLLFLATRSYRFDFDGDKGKLRYAFYKPPKNMEDSYEDDFFLSVSYAHDHQASNWSLTAVVRTFRMNQKHSNKRTVYRLEADLTGLTTAKREVYFLFGDSPVQFDQNGMPYETLDTLPRKRFEKPLMPNDLSQLETRMEGIMYHVAQSHK